MKCGQSVHREGSFYSSACGKDALFFAIPSNYSEGTLKPEDVSLYDIKRSIYCKFHKSVEVRRSWSGKYEESFIALDSPEAKPYLDRLAVLQAEHNAEVAAENAKKAAEKTEREKVNNKAEWEAYDASVTLTPTEEHEERYTPGWTRHEFHWDSRPNTPRGHYDEYRVEVVYDDIRATDEWQDIDPVYVRVRSTGTFTPAQARAVAESLLLAARKAEEVTGQRHAAREALLEPAS